MEGMECDDDAFSRRPTPEIVFQENPNSVSKLANWIIVDIFKYIY